MQQWCLPRLPCRHVGRRICSIPVGSMESESEEEQAADGNLRWRSTVSQFPGISLVGCVLGAVDAYITTPGSWTVEASNPPCVE